MYHTKKSVPQFRSMILSHPKDNIDTTWGIIFIGYLLFEHHHLPQSSEMCFFLGKNRFPVGVPGNSLTYPRSGRSSGASTTASPTARPGRTSSTASAISGPPCCGPWTRRPWRIWCRLAGTRRCKKKTTNSWQNGDEKPKEWDCHGESPFFFCSEIGCLKSPVVYHNSPFEHM